MEPPTALRSFVAEDDCIAAAHNFNIVTENK